MDMRKKINDSYIKYIDDNYEEVKSACIKIKPTLKNTGVWQKDHLIAKPLTIQKIYTSKDEETFKYIVKTLHGICDKVIKYYIENPEYRKLFRFPKKLEDLILLNPGYEDTLPIGRFDIFYNEDDGSYKFCEINTDGASAMYEDVIWDDVMKKNPAHQYIKEKFNLRQNELFMSWVKTFLKIYEGYDKKVKNPRIAIIDFLDTGTINEFEAFATAFRKAGFECEVCDVRELTYDGKLRMGNNKPIDAIYRRAVTGDIIRHYEEVTPLIEAIKDGAVFMAGSFRTQVVHSKVFFTNLHLPETKNLLTNEEKSFVEEHIPYTWDFAPGSIDLKEVIENKDKYILKPNDSYGASGVIDGLGNNKEKWEEVAKEYYGNGYICQEYCPPFRTKNIDFMFGNGEYMDYINMTGLFAYNGKYAGAYTRLSGDTLIVSYGNERSVASYII